MTPTSWIDDGVNASKPDRTNASLSVRYNRKTQRQNPAHMTGNTTISTKYSELHTHRNTTILRERHETITYTDRFLSDAGLVKFRSHICLNSAANKEEYTVYTYRTSLSFVPITQDTHTRQRSTDNIQYCTYAIISHWHAYHTTRTIHKQAKSCVLLEHLPYSTI